MFVDGQPKTDNESVFYNVDAIHEAINEQRKIRFKYFGYNVKKQRVYRKNGALYVQTLVALCWKDDNYYLMAYSAEHSELRHYRVDRMAKVSVLAEPRDDTGRERFNVAEYTKRIFGMYSGEIIRAKLSFDPSLVNVIFDRFGRDVNITEEPNGWAKVSVEVSASPVFLGWLLQFGNKAKIISPDSLIEAMKTLLSEVTKNY